MKKNTQTKKTPKNGTNMKNKCKNEQNLYIYKFQKKEEGKNLWEKKPN